MNIFYIFEHGKCYDFWSRVTCVVFIEIIYKPIKNKINHKKKILFHPDLSSSKHLNLFKSDATKWKPFSDSINWHVDKL